MFLSPRLCYYANILIKEKQWGENILKDSFIWIVAFIYIYFDLISRFQNCNQATHFIHNRWQKY